MTDILSVKVNPLLLVQGRQPEVYQVHGVPVVMTTKHQVVRFQVVVDDPAAVDQLQPFQDLHTHHQRGCHGEIGRVFEAGVEAASELFHHEAFRSVLGEPATNLKIIFL